MNIYEAIADIMKEGCVISKEKYNQQQKFKYRGIDDVMNVFQPLMAARGIFVVPEVLENHREERHSKQGSNLIYSVLKVKYTFFASDGSSISAVVIGEGMDSADKASNKALAAAMKYAMFQTFCIPTAEMEDPDGSSPPASTPAPPPPPAPQPAPPTQQDVHFRCNKCGKAITSYFDKHGKPVPVRKHAEASMAKFSQVLCLDCISQITAEINAGGNTNNA